MKVVNILDKSIVNSKYLSSASDDASELSNSGASSDGGASKLSDDGKSDNLDDGESELSDSGESELSHSDESELSHGGASKLSDDSKSELSDDGASKLSDGGKSRISETYSVNTINQLSQDPLFFVLSNFLTSGELNIVDALLKINANLSLINTTLKDILKINTTFKKDIRKNKFK